MVLINIPRSKIRRSGNSNRNRNSNRRKPSRKRVINNNNNSSNRNNSNRNRTLISRSKNFNFTRNFQGVLPASNRSRSFRGPFTNNYGTTRLYAPKSLGFSAQNFQPTDITITRSMYIYDVIRLSNSTFRLNAETLHPSSFPWISNLSKMYDKYMFLDFSCRYITNSSTDVSGSAIIAYNYEDHHTLPTTLIQSQGFDKFTIAPVWTESEWISIPRRILVDKWYDTEPSSPKDSFHDISPARLVYGYEVPRTFGEVTIGRIEARFTIRFSRPTADVALRPPGLRKFDDEKLVIESDVEDIDIEEISSDFSKIKVTD